MIFCHCAALACSDEPGKCTVETFLRSYNFQQSMLGKPQLAADAAPAQIKAAMAAFYRHHHTSQGIRPCGVCTPKVLQEITDICSGASCKGPLVTAQTEVENHVPAV